MRIKESVNKAINFLLAAIKSTTSQRSQWKCGQEQEQVSKNKLEMNIPCVNNFQYNLFSTMPLKWDNLVGLTILVLFLPNWENSAKRLKERLDNWRKSLIKKMSGIFKYNSNTPQRPQSGPSSLSTPTRRHGLFFG